MWGRKLSPVLVLFISTRYLGFVVLSLLLYCTFSLFDFQPSNILVTRNPIVQFGAGLTAQVYFPSLYSLFEEAYSESNFVRAVQSYIVS